MTKRHEIKFKSYDRLFPNQDTMPKGEFGNLIALPMQRNARKNKNSVFVDKSLEPYKDQWSFLSSISKLTKDEIEFYISEFCSGDELGDLKEDIIVHTQQLLDQWRERLSQFLVINEVLEVENTTKRGRKKKLGAIGQIGAGKNNLNGIIDIAIIDIAIMQSLVRKGEVKELVKDYGMVLVDECHHVSAFSFEQILKNVTAKYVYGLTATPMRKDGHHPIIFMQCGPIRYKVDARRQAKKHPFEHYVIPRFTSFRKPVCQDEKEWSIAEIYSEISTSQIRNELIINDVINCVKEGINPIVLTERTAHVEMIADALKEKITNVIMLTGRMSVKEKKAEIEKLSSIPKESSMVIVATGKFVGEGFDEPRLDTLFLAMPISWKGTLQQYAGRFHRIYENKNEVQIYDYVDVHVGVLERMYEKRLK
nr:DEAD/DEAH box helicase family protein [Clostridium thailandense]